MGIDVRLETERAEPLGEPVLDQPGYLAQALATARGSCVGYIDPYGNTIFNQLQLPVLIAEMEGLQMTLPSHLSGHVSKVLDLLRTGVARPHVYARFIGD
jgi:hypothetical protein